METTKTSHLTCQSNSFISIFFTCQVSACELQPFSCLDLANLNDIYSQTAKLDQVTDSFGLADCQELTFFLYFDQLKTSRCDSVNIYLVDQRGPATVRNLFRAMLSFLENYVTHNFSHFRAALTRTTLLSAWSPI